MKTYQAKKGELQKEHYVIDAEGKILGRIATRVATILCGKHKSTYTPHVDTGDFVDILNVDKVRVTGKKATDKIYKTYSGYPSGQKEQTFARVLERKPKRILEDAVRRMLPKNRLASKMIKKMNLHLSTDKPSISKKAIQVKYNENTERKA